MRTKCTDAGDSAYADRPRAAMPAAGDPAVVGGRWEPGIWKAGSGHGFPHGEGCAVDSVFWFPCDRFIDHRPEDPVAVVVIRIALFFLLRAIAREPA